jgi:ABC-2 type transport system permease protein
MGLIETLRTATVSGPQAAAGRVELVNGQHQTAPYFPIQLFQSAIPLGTGLAVLALVFGQTTELNGWSQPELHAVMGVHILMGGVIGTFIQPDMVRLIEDIRLGTLDFVLTKPDDAQVLVSLREIRIWQAVGGLVGAIVIVVAVAKLQASFGLGQAFAIGLAFVLGA